MATVSISTLRRRAREAGYRIVKSRKVNFSPDDQGEYMLVDVSTNLPLVGYKFDADLDDIAAFLADDGE